MLIAALLAVQAMPPASPAQAMGAPPGGGPVTIPVATTVADAVYGQTVPALGIIVRYKPGAAPAGAFRAAAVAKTGAELLPVPAGTDPATLLAQLRADPGVLYVEPNYELHALAAPNDPDYSQQWALPEIDASSAWTDAAAIGSPTPVTVAVVDTGVDAAHEDLAGRVLPGRDVISGAPDPTATGDDSADGHGTAVAGIMVAATNNGKGIAGVDGGLPVEVLPVKALDAAGIGTMFDVAQGIEWAADQGARVINLSLGARLPDFPQTLADAVVYAQNKGVLVVAAAGNEGQSIQGFYPAGLPGVVAVGATDSNHQQASFSNWGAGVVPAPGVDIETTLPGSRYGSVTGTSFAAPFVSGTAALAWSAHPAVTAEQVATALREGMQTFCPVVWYQCYPVLDADGALGKLAQGVQPAASLSFTAPADGAHVAGSVPLIVQATDAASVARVDFLLLDDQSSPTVVASVYGPASASGGNQSGIFAVTWTSSAVTDGPHTLGAASYAADGSQIDATADLDVIVANHPTTGLSLAIRKPDGSAAGGAAVTIYDPTCTDPNGCQPVFSGQADLQGNVIVPGATATDGNDFLVTARGTGPDFFYYKLVRAPAQITVDATGAQSLTVTGQRTDHSFLVGAGVTADLLAGNVPGAADPALVVARVALGQLDASGRLPVTLTRGQYNLRLLAADSTYYLAKDGVAVTAATSTLAFAPGPGDVTTLTLAPDVPMASASLSLSDEGDGFAGFAALGANTPVTVTPGSYSAVVDAVYHDSSTSLDWNWSLQVPRFSVAGGQPPLVIAFGPPLSATLATSGSGPSQPGSTVYFQAGFTDAHGNATTSLSVGPNRTAPPLSLQVRDATGQPAPGTVVLAMAWGVGWWISTGAPAGTYTATVSLNAGPLGTPTSAPLTVTLGTPPPPPSSALTVTALGASGTPLPGADVRILQRQSGAYYPVVGGESWTDTKGVAGFAGLTLDPQGVYALVVTGGGMLITQPLAPGSAPQAVTVDASTLALHQVSLQTEDGSGQAADSEGMEFSAYAYDADGVAIPVPEVDQALQVAEGRYAFQADQSQTWGGDFYHLVSPVLDVTSDQTVVLGGPGQVTDLTVTPVGSTAEYQLSGIALFGLGTTVSPLFASQDCAGVTLHVSPGTVQAEAVLVRQHYDGPWAYWLDGQLAPSAGAPLTWKVDDAFTAHITLDAGSYGLGDTLRSTHLVADGQGNRLVAVRTGNSNFPACLGATAAAQGAAGTPAPLAWRVAGAGPRVFLPSAGGALQAQSYQEIAPFLVIRDPGGDEIYRHKDPGETTPDHEPVLPTTGGPPPGGTSTFFGGSYTIPQDAVSGAYSAALELGAGPDGDLTAQAGFQVSAAPRLDQPGSPTNAASVTLTGTAAPGGQVAVSYSLSGGAPVAAGTATAGADSRFSLQVALPAEGSYSFTASNGGGAASAPVTLVVDRTPPGPPQGLTATPEDQSHISLDWTAPADPDVAGYRVSRDGTQVGAPTTPGFLDAGLQPGTSYDYAVVAVDQAGNVSAPATVTASTTTTADQMPPTAPTGLTATAIPGGAHLAWQASTDNVGVVGYHVHRATGGAAATVAGTVYGGTLAYDDTGLAAETTYTWTVTAFDAVGNESQPSAAASLTTAGLQIRAVNWQPTQRPYGLLVPGSSVAVTLLAESGRQASGQFSFQSWYDEAGNLLGSPASRTGSVTLTEDARNPGVYRGSFTLPSGTSALSSITGSLSDGAGHTVTATAAGLPLGTTGDLAVQIASPVAFPAGTRLMSWSQGTSSGATVPVGSPGGYVLAALAPASDYEVRVLSPTGATLEDQTRVTVQAGLQTPVSLAPPPPATLDVQVVAPGTGGLAGVPGVRLSLTVSGGVAGNGTYAATSGGDGWATAPDGTRPVLASLLAGQEVSVVASVGEMPYVDGQTLNVTLRPGGNQVQVLLQPLPVASLAGTVTFASGEPAAGTSVTVYDRSGGRNFDRTATTDAQGHYAVDGLPAGTAAVAFNDRRASPQYVADVALTSGGAAQVDAVLEGMATVTVAVDALYAGAPAEVPLALDWRTAVHFSIVLQNLRTHQSLGWGQLNTLPDVKIGGVPGDAIQVSVAGMQAGLSKQVVTVTLDDQNHATATVHLVDLGQVRAAVRTAGGGAPPAGAWWADLDRTDTPSPQRVASAGPGVDGSALWTGLASGTYRATFYWGTPGKPVAGVTPVTVDGIQVQEGHITDLGTVILPPQPQLVQDQWNYITADRATASPGTVVTLRAGWFAMSGSLVANPRLTLTVPAGSTYVDGSLRVSTGDPAAVQGNQIVINLRYLSYYSSPDMPLVTTGTATYQVRIADQPGSPLLVASALLQQDILNGTRWDTGTVAYDEAGVQVPGVSLLAPGTTQTDAIVVSGLAAPGSTVTVLDGEYTIGETTVPAGGYWRLSVTLADRGRPSFHTLLAQVPAPGGGTLTSQPVGVLYADPAQAGGQITSVTMFQTDGRHVTFDPRQGVAVFPYVWVPSMPLTFQIAFAQPDAVTNVQVVTCHGTDPCQSTPATRAGGVYTAVRSAAWAWSYNVPGDIYVTYDPNPQPWTPTPQPSFDAWKAMLPEALRDATYTVGSPGSGGSGPYPVIFRSPTISFDLDGDPGKQLNGSMTITQLDSYTPQDASLPPGSPPVYDFQAELTQQGDQVVLHASFVLPQGVAQGRSAVASRGIEVGLADLVEMTWESAFSNGTTIQSIEGALTDGSGGVLSQLGQILDQAASNCGPNAQQGYRDRADAISKDVMASLALNALLTAAGLGFSISAVGLPAGLAFWAISAAATEAVNAKIDSKVEQLKQDMAADPDCNHNPPGTPPGSGPAATPHWVVDPSGYVYEAVYGNRLEGVTATALQEDPTTGAWSVWDATGYGQENPTLTDPEGRYGWDVPEGGWQITYSKPGYQTGQSPVLTVPPPRTDVNVGLVSLAPPAVTGITATPGFIQVDFDSYVLVSTLSATTVSASVYGGGTPVAGSVTPVGPQNDDQGVQVAEAVRLVPDTPLTVGDSIQVSVSQMVQSYAGTPMAADVSQVVTVAGADTTPPGEVTGPQASAGDRSLTLTWTDPTDADFSQVHVAWRQAGGSFGAPASVAPGTGFYVLSPLLNGTAYDVRLTTLDRWGNESAGVTITATPQAPALNVANPGGGGTNPGGGGTFPPAPVPASQSVTTLPFLGGTVSVDVPAGALPAGVIVAVQQAPEAPQPVSPDLVPNGPAFDMSASGVQPTQPLTLTVRYNPAALGGADPRLLGVYVQDPQYPAVWRYVGGVVDPSTATIRVQLTHLSRYAVMAYRHAFADLQGHWAQADVSILTSRQVIDGVTPAAFEPDRPITRAEVAKLLVTALAPDASLAPPAVPTFGDVSPNAWYDAYVEAAARAGIVEGDGGRFRPDDPVTRQELAAMLVRALGLRSTGSEALPFADGGQVAGWARAAVALAWEKGLIAGMTPSTFAPLSDATRAEAAVAALRAMERSGSIVPQVTLSGTLGTSDIEAHHFELVTGDGTRYVLLPVGAGATQALAALVGGSVKVTGLPHVGPDIYMRGPVIEVLEAGSA